ncbi:hypothetical protein K432DRAFT_379096 [Lepidopterella palustris CBS 459.81]|uniref:Uncharacterized protein n=1 Tax=Lepidopterella palustris CBS 459.81 TaxID=1314670 RepID=A0A8E2EH28_9PEZI|nr:hypothetical protein K432DRAFT_379096 [Lepidopterella palustris CBS 459.81]
MDWRLLEYAKDSEDVAAGLQIFLDEIPQYAKDITGDIAELFAISSALHVLDEGLDLSRYGRYSGRIMGDLDLALPSLGHTLDDIRHMFGKSNRSTQQHPGAFPGTPQYGLIWDDLCMDFKNQGMDLPSRLEMYRVYLQGLYDILKGDPMDPELDHIRSCLTRLLRKQEPLDTYIDRLSIDPETRTPGAPYSRPPIGRYSTYPAYAPPPPPPLPPRPPYPHSPIYDDRMSYIPPPVPEIPQSPTYSTTSSQTYSTYSNDSGSGLTHWASKIFDGRHSSTPFRILGQSTKCLGRDEPEAIERLESEGFIKVLELPFEATDVWIRLYWRPSDHRARILFLTLDSHGRKMRYCIPLTALKVLRTESCLQLCRVNRADGKLDLWANLRFTLYERMVLFYCTAVAMKRQDRVTTPQGLEDFFQPGEKEEFGGEIQDDNYLHAFRIFRDKDSGCVRFETTARRGAMKTIPIWTAFVTQYIGSKSWMRRVGSSTVQLRELHPYVFCDGYTPPKGASGRFELTFTLSEDAKAFMETFHRIKTR